MSTALIVGAGASGLLHALSFRSAGVPIRGIYDPDFERAALLADIAGGKPYSDFSEAAALESDIAAICSPPIHHVAQAETVARFGRLTFLEKPIALSDGELARLRRLPNIVPTLQWRAGKSARELRAAIAKGLFGRAPQIHCDLRLWRDAGYYEKGRRGAAQWGCGAMLSIGIHAIDLAVWILGRPIAEAHGREWRGRPDVDVATQSELTIAFEGGAAAVLRLTTDAVGRNDVRFIVSGESGSAMLLADEFDPTATALTWRGIAGTCEDAGGATGSPLLVPFVHEAISAFRAGEPTVSVDDVADAHRVACALEQLQAPSLSRPFPP